MFNLVRAKDLKEYQTKGSYDVFVDNRSCGLKLEGCKELAIPECIASYFKFIPKESQCWEDVDVLLTGFLMADVTHECVIKLMCIGSSGTDVNLVVSNEDDDSEFSWRACLGRGLEKCGIHAEVR